MIIKILLLIVLINSVNTFAEDSWVDITAGAFYRQRSVYRGALIWDAPTLAIGPSFKFFNFISFGAGGGLSFYKRFAERHKVSLGLRAYDDNGPNGPVIELGDEEEDYKNLRGSTFETYLQYDFKYGRYVNTVLTYYKDIKRHKGNFTNLKISTAVIPFFNIGASFGVGDARHNRYLYGPEGTSGLGYYDLFSTLFLPFLPWKGRLLITYTTSKITQTENQQADYIRGQDRNNNFSVGALWSF